MNNVMNNNIEWLIRTAQNQIIGPLTREELCSRIQDGKLSPQDEICPGGGYWIFMYENEEVSRFLGITLKGSGIDHDEVTLTQTQTQTDTLTDTSVLREPRKPAPYAIPSNSPAGAHHSLLTATFWRAITWILGVAIAVVVYSVFRLTHPN